MLRLSVNLLSNAYHFLRELNSCHQDYKIDSFHYYKPYSVSIDSILELCVVCKWVTSSEYLAMTDEGQAIISVGHYEISPHNMRLMLASYIEYFKPIWSCRIPYGRKEATIFMTKDETACFMEAGLLSSQPPHDVVEWWDNISLKLRDIHNANILSVGRHGEELTLIYEKNRTNNEPTWVSIDSNKLGFDIISQQNDTDKTQLLIEVKASSEPIDVATLHISRNEWSVANNSKKYYFYIWLISPRCNRLAIIAPNVISQYIPINQKDGAWESVCIPFTVFKPYFAIIDQ